MNQTYHNPGGSQATDDAKKPLPLAGLQALAESIAGTIEWQDATTGFCRCPGQHFHTRANGKRDCRVTLDRVPTVFCVHSSCGPQIERVNHALRSAIGKAKFSAERTPGKRWRASAEDRQRQREREAYQRLKLRAERSLSQILETFATEPAELFEESPVRLFDDPANDWRLLMQLYGLEDILWIGDKYDSGCGHERNFRRVADWLRESNAPGPLVCPNTFKTGVHSRSNANVMNFRFLVVESDTLAKNAIVGVFAWMRHFLRLRAAVDTAGKSIHGWFDYPTTPALHELKNILPNLGCDPALFKPSQPCRLPGARRGDKTQALLYLDLEGVGYE
jgi:hypothetical protein